MYNEIINVLTDPWILFGFTAQFVFFLRFVIQWIASEKAGETRVPVAFWYLSIAGALMIFVYALYRKDIVFIAGQLIGLVIYFRNLVIFYRNRSNSKTETQTT